MTGNLNEKLFWSVHQDLPREGPGDDASTLRALSMMDSLPETPKILDIGCGPGAQTVALATATQGRIIAVDTHQPFLDDLARRTDRAGVSQHVNPVKMSMFDLDFDRQFDVLWSEGAIYINGFEAGLRAWRPLLRSGGYVAVTEITWLKTVVSEEPRRFWEEAYPDMADVAENLARLTWAGYQHIGHFTLPESAWWENYYDPMDVRIKKLRQVYADNPEAQQILDTEAAEIALYRQYSDAYGYVFYVMQIA